MRSKNTRRFKEIGIMLALIIIPICISLSECSSKGLVDTLPKKYNASECHKSKNSSAKMFYNELYDAYTSMDKEYKAINVILENKTFGMKYQDLANSTDDTTQAYVLSLIDYFNRFTRYLKDVDSHLAEKLNKDEQAELSKFIQDNKIDAKFELIDLKQSFPSSKDKKQLTAREFYKKFGIDYHGKLLGKVKKTLDILHKSI